MDSCPKLEINQGILIFIHIASGVLSSPPASHFCLHCSDACRLAQRRDALLSLRALFERNELVRLPQTGVRSLL